MSEDWTDWESSDDEKQLPSFKSFFDDSIFNSPQLVFEHDEKQTNGAFHFVEFIRERGLDDYSTIKLINYIRRVQQEEGIHSPEEFANKLKQSGNQEWEDEQYLIPTLPEDPLLTLDFTQLLDRPVEDSAEIESLRKENLLLKRELEWMKLDSSTRKEIQSIMNEQENSTADQSMSTPQTQKHTDSLYFSSYSSVSIHREMLEDKVRMEAYQTAIEGNKDLFDGKIVMDVGCGTGILSLLACRAGARRVFAIEASDWAAKMAKLNIQENGYNYLTSSNSIQVIHGQLEEVDNALEPVDIIISEWMGYSLLFESMLNTVLYARDKWLKADGVILPNKANLLLAGASKEALDLEFWKDVCGFRMNSVAQDIYKGALKTPLIHQVSPDHLLTSPVNIKTFDLSTMSPTDMHFTSQFLLEHNNPDQEDITCHAVVLWFSVEFTEEICRQQQVILSTSPFEQATHWLQTVLPLQTPVSSPIEGQLSFTQGDERRGLEICLQCRRKGEDKTEMQTMLYSLLIKG